MNKPKKQGTQWETTLVTHLTNHNLKARRLAEGGTGDPGDIEVWAQREPFPYLIIEAKAAANLNTTQTLAKAKRKAGAHPAVVAWKRLTRKGDNQRRSPDGEPVVVIMDLATFTALIGGRAQKVTGQPEQEPSEDHPSQLPPPRPIRSV